MEIFVGGGSGRQFPEKLAADIPINVVVPRHDVESVPIKPGSFEKLVEELSSDHVLFRLTGIGNVTSCEHEVRRTAIPLAESPYRSDERTKYDMAIVRIVTSNVQVRNV